MRSLVLCTILLSLSSTALAPGAHAQDKPAADAAPPVYDLLYDVRVLPSQKAAQVQMRVSGQGAWALKRVTFATDPARHRDFEGDGELDVRPGEVVWRPRPQGGVLKWTFQIDHLRDESSYDARTTSSWALFRGDDLVPPARVRTDQLAEANARLRLRLPDKWRAAVTFDKRDDGLYDVDSEERRFDRPTGWFLLGRLKLAITKIAGVRVKIAYPKKHRMRGQDMLAFLRWTLPDMKKATGELPDRLLVVSAADPMWRGGLSGPGSLYLHADRPLIDERDYSSPILHEVMHAAMRARSGDDGDWVVEGLAELYSIETLRRSKAITKSRYRRALRKMFDKGKDVTTLRVRRAGAKVTARGVWVLHQLDVEMKKRCKEGLDGVLKRYVAAPARVSTEDFRAVAEDVGQCELGAFFRRWVPSLEPPTKPHAVPAAAPGQSVPIP